MNILKKTLSKSLLELIDQAAKGGEEGEKAFQKYKKCCYKKGNGKVENLSVNEVDHVFLEYIIKYDNFTNCGWQILYETSLIYTRLKDCTDLNYVNCLEIHSKGNLPSLHLAYLFLPKELIKKECILEIETVSR